MSRTLELGRAVLSSSTACVQLRVTTSISISPQQDVTNLHQLGDPDLLEVLISRNVWVCRGNGLHLVLQLNVQGEPLGQDKRKELANIIVSAQVWSQLNLYPSLLADNDQENALPDNSGIIQINLSHVDMDSDMSRKKSHRICSGLSFAYANPPDGVTRITLQSVRYVMEVERIKARKHTGTHKRLKKTEDNETSEMLRDEGPLTQPEKLLWLCLDEDGDDSDALLHDFAGLHVPILDAAEFPFQGSAGRKKRQKRRRKPVAITDTTPTTEHHLPLAIQEAAKLVDVAMRLSICQNPLRMPRDVRVVKSAFTARLAEISPALFSPGYLPALSQRAPFLSIITHSLTRSGSLKSKSISLRVKTESLKANLAPNELNNFHYESHLDSKDFKNLTRSVNSQLWKYLQRKIFEKRAARSLKPFSTFDGLMPPLPYSDDILDECLGREVLDDSASFPINASSDTSHRPEGAY